VRQTGFSTKVGSTTDTRPGSDVVVVSEPSLGATLRTKGRFYFLCEVVPAGRAGEEIAREVADLTRSEYEYDLSAGIETALRKALRDGNRRAAQRLRDQRGRVTLHCACAVVVNNELYAARIGAAQIFLVRRARLFLPGDDDDELADFVHRTTTRRATSLGSDPELLPAVWKQTVSVGDTIILAGPATVTTLGAEALLNAAVTLHPRAAAEHVHNRFVAEAGAGTDVALFIEIAPASTTVPRLDNTGVTGHYRSSEGVEGDSVWGTRGRWTMLTGVLGGKPVTLAMLDHPKNVGFPTYWHARGYGLFAANPLGLKIFSNGKEQLNFRLGPGQSTTFRHRVLILSGTATPQQIEAYYQDFAR